MFQSQRLARVSLPAWSWTVQAVSPPPKLPMESERSSSVAPRLLTAIWPVASLSKAVFYTHSPVSETMKGSKCR